ncbi:GNAT family N-acetyltransferase [Citrobacter sp. Cu096]|uniref:GNAT family N-acetyltransferase n=1 Tax=Citrobacter sp. Cu096 TaxID=2985158 RepID=UPI00257663C2|nr:GNAT family N-acetyltransferase [Citrobacter sp. Cu096]MDM2741781.1 GNAT family N-acetyltransferase [Citrobacter sp. Cu096]
MITALEKADLKLITELKVFYKCYYSEDNKLFNEKYLPWLLHDNPHGEGISVNIKIDNELVANMFLIPVRLIQDGSEKHAYYATDVLTHPTHRDKNLFVKLIRRSIEYLKEQNACLIGHPNNNALPGWKRTKMHFQPIINSFLSKTSVLNKRKLVTDASQVKESEKQSIINMLCCSSNLIVASDMDFLTWRYINHPVRKYHVEFIYDKYKLVGVIVFVKFKGIFDRVVHYIVTPGSEGKVFNSKIFPRIFSFSGLEDGDSYKQYFYDRRIGSEINYFLTDFSSETPPVDGRYISFAACDN